MSLRNTTVAIAFLAAAYSVHVSPILADEPSRDTSTAERQALLKEMRVAVAAIKVTEKTGEQLQSAKLVSEPIFRYSDEQRQIRDATMWVWTVQGRPVSLMKLERYGFPEPERRWLHNLASTSPNLLSVTWPFDRDQ